MGTLQPSGEGPAFEVSMVRMDRSDGVVWHEGSGGEAPPFSIGASVSCQVDESKRLMAARLHSGGHLLDAAMTAAGCTLEPAKGYHFTTGSYVEYKGKLTAEERDELLPRLQVEVDRLVTEGIPTSVEYDSEGMRIVTVGGTACPCGGTHVASTADVGALKVQKIKSKGKVTRVSYSVN